MAAASCLGPRTDKVQTARHVLANCASPSTRSLKRAKAPVSFAYVPATNRSSDLNSFRIGEWRGAITIPIELSPLGYRISLGSRLVRRSTAGMISEDADINTAVRAFAINDIENLVGMNDR